MQYEYDENLVETFALKLDAARRSMYTEDGYPVDTATAANMLVALTKYVAAFSKVHGVDKDYLIARMGKEYDQQSCKRVCIN